MDNSTKSRIEILPDELWLRIFAYTPVLDLYNAWRNLNSRIDAILRSACISIYIENKSDDNTGYQNAMTHFASQIVHIKDERLNTTTSFQTWPVDLHSLVNFRSLYLARCSQEQFEQLLNFHQLTCLSLPCDYLSQDFLRRFVIGKEREERFPQLRSIGRIWCNERKHNSSSSFIINTKIQHVHLVMPSKDSIVDFLQYLPALSLITADYLAQENTVFSSCFIMAKLRRQQNDYLSNISSKMDVCSKTVDQKNMLLLTIAACILRLEIDFNGYCDFGKLLAIFHQCSILEKLRITVKYYPKDLSLTAIRQLSPFFAGITFGDVQKETGKPVLIVKWPS